jgi:hypothetical protein
MLSLLMHRIRAINTFTALHRVCTRPDAASAARIHVQVVPSPSLYYQVSSRPLACAAGSGVEATEDLPNAGGRLDELLPTHCCGCGIKLQRDDENVPGCAFVGVQLPFLQYSINPSGRSSAWLQPAYGF